MTDLTEIANQVKRYMRWQEMPEQLTDEEYLEIVRQAVRTLYVDTGRGMQFPLDYSTAFIEDEEGTLFFYETLYEDEKRYVFLVSVLSLIETIRMNSDELQGWSTDAMKVTHADKPFQNLTLIRTELETERRRTFYSMNRYSVGV